jgi:hypothetical protein
MRVFLDELLLNPHRAIDGRNDAFEFGEDGISCRARDAPAIFADRGIDGAPVAGEDGESSGFVALHVPTEAHEVGGEDRDELALQMWGFHPIPHPRYSRKSNRRPAPRPPF